MSVPNDRRVRVKRLTHSCPTDFRTPFFPTSGGSGTGTSAAYPVVSPTAAWAAHGGERGGNGDDFDVGVVKSDLIENVFGNANRLRTKTSKEKLAKKVEKGGDVLRRQTQDYSRPNKENNNNSNKSSGTNRWEPLYRLARLDPTETRLNTRKLKSLLDSYGEYPTKYRLLCWRFLLQLPENHDAFAILANKEIHPAFVGLTDRYPLKNQRVFKKFQSVLSSLAHWSPVFGEAEFVPGERASDEASQQQTELTKPTLQLSPTPSCRCSTWTIWRPSRPSWPCCCTGAEAGSKLSLTLPSRP